MNLRLISHIISNRNKNVVYDRLSWWIYLYEKWISWKEHLYRKLFLFLRQITNFKQFPKILGKSFMRRIYCGFLGNTKMIIISKHSIFFWIVQIRNYQYIFKTLIEIFLIVKLLFSLRKKKHKKIMNSVTVSVP